MFRSPGIKSQNEENLGQTCRRVTRFANNPSVYKSPLSPSRHNLPNKQKVPTTRNPSNQRPQSAIAPHNSRLANMRTLVSLLLLVLILAPTVSAYRKHRSRCRNCSKENFKLLNSYRASKGKRQLKWRESLASRAATHSKVMYRRRHLFHSRYVGWENVAYG